MQPHQLGNSTQMCLIPYLVIFTLENNFDSKAKRLCKTKNICLKHIPGNQIVATVKIKIATVESPRHPLPLLPKPATRLPPTKKTRAGNSSLLRSRYYSRQWRGSLRDDPNNGCKGD